jgi:hypothetical protein
MPQDTLDDLLVRALLIQIRRDATPETVCQTNSYFVVFGGISKQLCSRLSLDVDVGRNPLWFNSEDRTDLDKTPSAFIRSRH